MYENFKVKMKQEDGTEKIFDRPGKEAFCVLYRDPGSIKWNPIFHTENMKSEPALDKETRLPVITSKTGAVDYIRLHSAGVSPVGEYMIKDRGGNIA